MTQDIEILQFLHYNPEASRAEIGEALTNAPSPATLKRPIAEAVRNGYIEVVGRGPATRYRLSHRRRTSRWSLISKHTSIKNRRTSGAGVVQFRAYQ